MVGYLWRHSILLLLLTLPHHPPQTLSPAHLFICAIHDYYSGCEKVAQNPTVLIASRNSYKTLPKGLFQLYSISNMATSHTRKSHWFQYLILVFLKMPNSVGFQPSKPAEGQHVPGFLKLILYFALILFLKIDLVCLFVCVCVCVCPLPRL